MNKFTKFDLETTVFIIKEEHEKEAISLVCPEEVYQAIGQEKLFPNHELKVFQEKGLMVLGKKSYQRFFLVPVDRRDYYKFLMECDDLFGSELKDYPIEDDNRSIMLYFYKTNLLALAKYVRRVPGMKKVTILYYVAPSLENFLT